MISISKCEKSTKWITSYLNVVLIFSLFFLFNFTFASQLNSLLNSSQLDVALFQNLSKDVKSVSSAIIETIHKFYLEKSEDFDIRIYGEISSHINDVISEIARKKKFVSTIKHFPTIDRSNCKFNHSSLILTSTIENVNELNNNANVTNFYPILFKVLFYCEEENLDNLELPAYNFSYIANGHIHLFEYFIVNTDGTVNIYTLRYFTEVECYKLQIINLDQFDGESKKWEGNLKNSDNFRHFHKCTVAFPTQISYFFYFENQEENSDHYTFEKLQQLVGRKNVKFRGAFYEIVETIAREGNFTSYYQLVFADRLLADSEGKKKKNLFSFTATILQNSNFLLKSPMFDVEWFFLLTPNNLYTNYELLFFPFDHLTWILLGLTFIFMFSFIFVINRTPRLRQLVYCEDSIVLTTYNIAGQFFGISQIREPVKTFPRIVLIFFIYFCLVIRTAYQGVLFDLMTGGLQKPLPETTNELISQNYTVITLDENKPIIGDLIRVFFEDERLKKY